MPLSSALSDNNCHLRLDLWDHCFLLSHDVCRIVWQPTFSSWLISLHRFKLFPRQVRRCHPFQWIYLPHYPYSLIRWSFRLFPCSDLGEWSCNEVRNTDVLQGMCFRSVEMALRKLRRILPAMFSTIIPPTRDRISIFSTSFPILVIFCHLDKSQSC